MQISSIIIEIIRRSFCVSSVPLDWIESTQEQPAISLLASDVSDGARIGLLGDAAGITKEFRLSVSMSSRTSDLVDSR